MKIFGIRLEAKREPRWGSYNDVLALSEKLTALENVMGGMYNSIEAMKKKVYRDEKKESPSTSPAVPSRVFSAGDVLTLEDLKVISGGDNNV